MKQPWLKVFRVLLASYFLFFIYILVDMYYAYGSRLWPSVPGEVVESSIISGYNQSTNQTDYGSMYIITTSVN